MIKFKKRSQSKAPTKTRILITILTCFFHINANAQNTASFSWEKIEYTNDYSQFYEGGNRYSHIVKFVRLFNDSSFTYQRLGNANTEIHYSAGNWELKNDSIIVLKSDLAICFSKMLSDSTLAIQGKHHKLRMFNNYELILRDNCLYYNKAYVSSTENKIDFYNVDTTSYFVIEKKKFINKQYGVVQDLKKTENGLLVQIDYGYYFCWVSFTKTDLSIRDELIAGQILENCDTLGYRPNLVFKTVFH